MEPLKNTYNSQSIIKLSTDLKRVYPGFNQSNFQKKIYSELDSLELKDRVRLIASTLKEFLPNNYSKAVNILVNSLAQEDEHLEQQWDAKNGDGVRGFMVWPLCQYIEDNGINYFNESMSALYEMTKRFTAEFSIRPFIQHYDDKVYQLLHEWSFDPSKHVRRLVSEGTRPHLPWGMKVDNITSNLQRNIDLLNNLKTDTDEYVIRSIANHLNDISKLDKALMLNTCRQWFQQKNKYDQWAIRHASRTLLKRGDVEALKLNGYTVNPQLKLVDLNLSSKKIKEGDSFELSFKLKSESRKIQNLLIDYVIYFPKKDGRLSPKVFRLKNLILPPNEQVLISKKIPFKKVTTRTHYAGKHLLKVKIANHILGVSEFMLLDV